MLIISLGFDLTLSPCTGMVITTVNVNELAVARMNADGLARELRTSIDTANAPIFGISKDGCVNEWNKAAAILTGYSNEDVYGKHSDEVLVAFGEECRSHIPCHSTPACSSRPARRVAVGRVLSKALKGTDTAQFEFPLVNQSGDKLAMLLNAAARRDTHGQIVGVICVGQDITAKKNTMLLQERVVCIEVLTLTLAYITSTLALP